MNRSLEPLPTVLETLLFAHSSIGIVPEEVLFNKQLALEIPAAVRLIRSFAREFGVYPNVIPLSPDGMIFATQLVIELSLIRRETEMSEKKHEQARVIIAGYLKVPVSEITDELELDRGQAFGVADWLAIELGVSVRSDSGGPMTVGKILSQF